MAEENKIKELGAYIGFCFTCYFIAKTHGFHELGYNLNTLGFALSVLLFAGFPLYLDY